MRLCLRLCRRWALSNSERERFDLPSYELCSRQADWLRGARSRLLRRAGIERCDRLLEIGAGWGIVANELCTRSGSPVFALDRRPKPESVCLHDQVDWLVGQAEQLPIADNSVDLVFAQFTFLWLDAPRAIAEVVRVLAPGGFVAVIEPDYGGLMECPEETITRPLWIAALQRAGADPFIGRKLPRWFAAAGLRVETRFPDRYETAEPSRLDFLTELPLSQEETRQVTTIQAWLNANPRQGISHLPLWMVLGEKQA